MNNTIPDGSLAPPRPRSRVFIPRSRFNIDDYEPLVTLFHREFEAQGGIIGIEIYYETLIALLDEPNISVMTRYKADISILQHQPIELSLLRSVHFDDRSFITVSVQSRFHARGHDIWGELRTSSTFDFLVPDSVVAFSTPENVASFLAENGVEASVNERHLLIFDDLYAQYMPSTFLWVDTDDGVFFIWMAYSNGPFASFRGDFIARLYTPEEFRANWQTLMCRETMDHNE